MVIAVAGNTGAGKSTLVDLLAGSLGLRAIPESVDDNPYLKPFYEDPKRWALQLQLHFLSARLKAAQLAFSGGNAILDRTLEEGAAIFVPNLRDAGWLTPEEVAQYFSAYEPAAAAHPAPRLLVYLRRSAESCHAQIARRNRPGESRLDLEFLKRLGARYDAWFDRYDRGPKLRVEADGRTPRELAFQVLADLKR